MFEWEWTGTEILNPFWCVQRITVEDLKKENESKGSEVKHREINMILKDKMFKVITNGVTWATPSLPANETTQIMVPLMVNEIPLHKGDELLLAIPGRVQTSSSSSKRKTWKTDIQPPQPKANDAAHRSGGSDAKGNTVYKFGRNYGSQYT